MEVVLEIVFGTVLTWVLLIIVVPIAGRIAEFSFPGWREALWKLAVVALATNALSTGVGLASGLLGWIAGVIVFWVLMVKWFSVDLFGAVIIVVVSWLLRIFLMSLLAMAL